jgi:hypothetical protein
MELAFETLALRDICESDVEARKSLPASTVDDLQARLADLRAATSASDLVAGRPTFDANPPGYIRFSLNGGYELVSVGNHPRPLLTDGGLMRLERVRRVRVVAISGGRPHG